MMRHKVAAVALVLLVVAPATVYGATETEVVTGHINYIDMDGLDPCLAAIAGVTRLRVMWFDDSILHERAGGGGWVYAIEHGAPAPVDQALTVSDKYHFEDPNGIWWTVVEAYFDHDYHYRIISEGDYEDPEEGSIKGNDGTTTKFNQTSGVHVFTERYYTWMVRIGNATYDAHAGTHDHEYYNFVNMVNTCKFNDWVENGTEDHTGNDAGYGHNATDGNHTHETYQVDLYVDDAPLLVPANAGPVNNVQHNETVTDEGHVS